MIGGGGWRHKRAARSRTCPGTADKTILAPVFTSPVATQATRLKTILPERLARFQADFFTRRFHHGGHGGAQRKKAEEWKEFTKAEPRMDADEGSGIAAIPVPLMRGVVTARDAYTLCRDSILWLLPLRSSATSAVNLPGFVREKKIGSQFGGLNYLVPASTRTC